jgi:hypothetical protein
MANSTALTIAGNTQTALLPRRSVDYQAWLIAELHNLAIVLGQEKALDSDGLRLAGMARALADTRQNVMTLAFARCERECTFLPAPKEVLTIYAQEMKKKLDADQAKKQAEADAEDARLKADAQAHPENYVSVGQLIQERGGTDNVLGDMRDRLRERLDRNKITIAEPKVHECPHCGGQVPEGIADLRGLSWEALRSMADRKQDHEATVGALLDRINAGAKSDSRTEVTNHRRRRDDSPAVTE